MVEFKWGCLPTTVSEMGDCKIVIYMYISSLTLSLLNHTLPALPSLSKFCHFGAETKSSVIHSHKGFFVRKLVRFGGKKLLKLPYLDTRFQQICQNIIRFLNFPLWPVAKFDEFLMWMIATLASSIKKLKNKTFALHIAQKRGKKLKNLLASSIKNLRKKTFFMYQVFKDEYSQQKEKVQ